MAGRKPVPLTVVRCLTVPISVFRLFVFLAFGGFQFRLFGSVQPRRPNLCLWIATRKSRSSLGPEVITPACKYRANIPAADHASAWQIGRNRLNRINDWPLVASGPQISVRFPLALPHPSQPLAVSQFGRDSDRSSPQSRPVCVQVNTVPWPLHNAGCGENC